MTPAPALTIPAPTTHDKGPLNAWFSRPLCAHGSFWCGADRRKCAPEGPPHAG